MCDCVPSNTIWCLFIEPILAHEVFSLLLQCGKSAAIYACAEEQGFDVIEVLLLIIFLTAFFYFVFFFCQQFMKLGAEYLGLKAKISAPCWQETSNYMDVSVKISVKMLVPYTYLE